jgi:hypothetical protein
MRPLSNVTLVAAILSAVIGCGGSNPPPEPPAASPEPPPAEAPASPPSGDGQHTMPDGTTMPGEQHGQDHEHQK